MHEHVCEAGSRHPEGKLQLRWPSALQPQLFELPARLISTIGALQDLP